MARGQERTVTGGQIDPYVQQSMAQGRGAAENRLVQAMQQTAQTQREREANATQAGIASSQMANQRNMQAAQLAADDKRAAEAEKARREDMKYRETYDKAAMSLQKEIESNRLNWEKARYDKDWERANEAEQHEMDLKKIDVALNMRQMENQRKITTALTKLGLKSETARQKMITLREQQGIESERATSIYNKSKANAYETAKDTMTLPVTGERVGATPIVAAQNEITKSQSKINIEDLTSSKLSNLEDQLVKGEITFTDLRTARAAIEGTIEAVDEKVKAAKGNKIAEEYWADHRTNLLQMSGNLFNLIHSNKKIANNPNMTIGAIARKAFGSIDGYDDGSAVNELLSKGVDFEGMYDAFSKSVDPYTPLAMPEGSLKSKSAQDYLNSINGIITGMNTGFGEVE